MAEFNWCHNPSCHKIATNSRIRGTGNNKVLRTRKIALNSEWIRNSIYAYFCNQQCLFQFLNKFAREVANLNPTLKPKEMPIKVERWKEDTERMKYIGNGQYERSPHQVTRTEIKLQNSTE
jgi:hypothetical protein